MAMQTTQTQTVLPEWYNQYAKDILSKATAATSQPYMAYGAPRIAGFQPEQEQAFGTYKSTMGEYQPFIQQAQSGLQRGTGSFTDTGVAQRYMNPYIETVVKGIGSAAGRNLYENILPQLNRTFVGTGTFGGSRSQEFMNRAVRDTQAAALAEQNKALAQGYDTAAGIYGSEAQRNLTAAPYMAALGSQAQEQRMKELAGLEQIGTQRQGLAQKSADLAYQDFLAQREYPYEQVQRLAAIGGVPSAQGAGMTTTSTPGPSTASQIGGLITSGIGLLGATNAFGGNGSPGWLASIFKAEGGEVSKKKAKKRKPSDQGSKSGLGWLKD